MNLNSMEFILEITCLKKIQDGTYVINLDEYEDVATHRIVLYVKDNKIVCFDSFGFGHVTKETEKFIGHKNIKKKKHFQSSSKQFNV